MLIIVALSFLSKKKIVALSLKSKRLGLTCPSTFNYQIKKIYLFIY